MGRLPFAFVMLAAACRASGGPPCTAPIPSTTLYDSYCPSAPQAICFVDHPTDL